MKKFEKKFFLFTIGFSLVSCGSSSSSVTFNPASSTETTTTTPTTLTNLAVAISSPTAGAKIALSNQAAYTISGTCVAGTSVAVTADTVSGSASCAAGTFSLAMDFSSLSDGAVTVSVVITDASNNTGTTTVALTKESAVCAAAAIGPLAGTFHAGDGSVGDPFIICDITELQNMRAHLTANAGTGHSYKLGNNIIGGGATVTPTTAGSFALTDIFDGNSFMISNVVIGDGPVTTAMFTDAVNNAIIKDLYMDQISLPIAAVGNWGAAILVGDLNNSASISNVHITNSTVTATGLGNFTPIAGMVGKMLAAGVSVTNSSAGVTITNNVNPNLRSGGLVGEMVNGTLTNSYSTGSLTLGGSPSHVTGGLVGAITAGTFSGNYSSVNVSVVGGGAGGLIGAYYLASGTLNNNYATGTVSSTHATATSLGGLIGLITPTNVTISNSHATGNISSAAGDYLGGLIGQSTSTGLTITKCYATGNVSAEQYSAGLVGFANGITVTDSYATGNVTVTAVNANVAGLVVEDWGAVAMNFTRAYYAGTMTTNGTGNRYPMLFPNGGGALTVTNGYFDTTLNPTAIVQGIARTTIELKDTTNRATIYPGFDFTTVWTENTTTNLPTLR